MPSMDVFIGSAAKHGNLVYYMNQSDTAPLNQDGPWGNIGGGYCAGLTVRWLRLTYLGTDFPCEPGFRYLGEKIRYFNGTDWQATAYQNKIFEYSKAASPTAAMRVQYALGLAQMLLAKDLLEDVGTTGATGARLFRILKQSYGGYYVSMRSKTEGHAIGMRHGKPLGGKGPGVLHIFDPNYGHFAWPIASSQWAKIIDSYLYFTGYAKDLGDAYTIGRATPPIG